MRKRSEVQPPQQPSNVVPLTPRAHPEMCSHIAVTPTWGGRAKCNGCGTMVPDHPAYAPANLNGLVCVDCGLPQYNTPSGVVCRSGHGGAEGQPGTIVEPLNPPIPLGPDDWPQVEVPLPHLIDAFAEIPSPAHTSPQSKGQAPDDVSDPSFENMNAAKEQPMSPAFERITTRIFIDDVEATYDKLETALRVGETRSDHGTLMKALDEAETNSRLAHRLWVTAKIEREKWELDNWPISAQMRSEATAELQREKEQKTRNKAITEDDIKAMCATKFPDEWPRQELRRAKVKAMESSMQNLAESWESRCRSLQTMLSKSR